jgi:hypothetical protein
MKSVCLPQTADDGDCSEDEDFLLDDEEEVTATNSTSKQLYSRTPVEVISLDTDGQVVTSPKASAAEAPPNKCLRDFIAQIERDSFVICL